MAERQVLDCIGVPEYFTTHIGAMEDAGNGMIRVVRCIERGGVLIPVLSVVTPAVSVLQDAPRFREMAKKIAMGGLAGSCTSH